MNETETKTPQEMKEKIESFRKLAFPPKQQAVSGSVAVIITIISDLLGGLLVGAGLGYLFMKLFGAHKIVLAIFVLLGGLAGLLNVYKSIKQLEGKSK